MILGSISSKFQYLGVFEGFDGVVPEDVAKATHVVVDLFMTVWRLVRRDGNTTKKSCYPSLKQVGKKKVVTSGKATANLAGICSEGYDLE
jgi:hypothetical protein